jgi:glycosyltransferase involved in cell wall biosynthesis
MKDCRISILMSVYNGEKYLAEAIESILGQTFTNFEFLIINNGSTDKSRKILLSYSDNRIKLIDNKINVGLIKSLNKGLDLALGKYIARMDADDISLPGRLQIQFEFMEKNPHIDVCGSWYEMFGNKNCITETPVQDKDIKETLFFHNCIAHPTVIIRKNTLDKYQIKYNENYLHSEDYELWCREVNRLKFANIPEALIKYRIHENQTGIAKRKEQDETADMVRKENLENTGLVFSEKEKKIFCDIIRNNLFLENAGELVEVLEFLDKIGTYAKNEFGPININKIKKYIRKYAEEGINSKKTSLILFFTILLKWNVYPTSRSKTRYFYHSIKNLILKCN